MLRLWLLPLFIYALSGQAQVYDLDWKLTKGETWVHEDRFNLEMMSVIPGMPRVSYAVINRATCEIIGVSAKGDVSLLFTYISSKLENGVELFSKFGVDNLIGIPVLVVFNHDRTLTVTPKKPLPRDALEQFDFNYQMLSMLQNRLFNLHRSGVRPGQSWTARNVAAFHFADFVQDSISDSTYLFKGETTFQGRKCLMVECSTRLVTLFSHFEGEMVSNLRESYVLDLESRYLLQLKSSIRQNGMLNTPGGPVALDFIIHMTSTASKARGEN